MQKVLLPEYRLEIWSDLIWINLVDHADPVAPRRPEGPENEFMTELAADFSLADSFAHYGDIRKRLLAPPASGVG